MKGQEKRILGFAWPHAGVHLIGGTHPPPDGPGEAEEPLSLGDN